MSMIRRRRWVAGLLLGMGSSAPSAAQDLPPALPSPPEGSALSPSPTTTTSPIARPTPLVIEVPPGGFRSTWSPAPIDPIALRRHPPKHAERKARSLLWRRLQGKLWGYPEEYEPRPLGASVYDHNRIMVANGTAAGMTLYRYDFLPNTSELNPRGLDQLSKIESQLAVSPFPLIVERTDENPALAESRRYAVLARLARGPHPVPSERVLVGVPTPVGLSGEDAYIVSRNSLGRTQGFGPPIPLNSNGVNSPSGVTTNGGGGGLAP